MDNRKYQNDAIYLCRSAYSKHRKIILKIPTGGGKTYIASQIIKIIIARNKRALFVVDRLTLVNQASKAFDAQGIPHGIIQGGAPRDYSQQLQVCSVQTLQHMVVPDADFVIIDEAHTVYKTHIDLMQRWSNVKFLGLTATPYTRGLGKIWDYMVAPVTSQELIDQKYLVDFDVFGPERKDLKKLKMIGGDYDVQQLSKSSNTKKLIGDIIAEWLKRAENAQTICSAVDIAHSKHIAKMFNDVGIRAAHVDCYCSQDEKNKIFDAFENEKVRVLCNVDIVGKGYDNPSVACVILARASKSRNLFEQQLGRGLRICDGKEKLLVLDHAGLHDEFGFITNYVQTELCNGKRKKEEAVKNDRLPVRCTSCGYHKKHGVCECPKCGFAPKKVNKNAGKESSVEQIDGDLVALKKSKSPKIKHTKEEKQKWYSMFLAYGKTKKYNSRWAGNMYRDKFGVWPARLEKCAVNPDEDVLGWIKYTHIKYAQRKKKATTYEFK